MPYQYVREPLTADESDRLPNACETATERLVVWTLLDTDLRVGELCGLTPRNVLWHQRQLRIKGKGGSHGKRAKVRVVPMSPRVRTLLLTPVRPTEQTSGSRRTMDMRPIGTAEELERRRRRAVALVKQGESPDD